MKRKWTRECHTSCKTKYNSMVGCCLGHRPNTCHLNRHNKDGDCEAITIYEQHVHQLNTLYNRNS